MIDLVVDVVRREHGDLLLDRGVDNQVELHREVFRGPTATMPQVLDGDVPPRVIAGL
ncbi:hypothetical protein [Rhodoplanes sp. SY1]|uniref:hypothetical protein n=1 Tax=Rhodoplanes sp. SY1 TaxID=3166646 RepID=UPI0038B5B76E